MGPEGEKAHTNGTIRVIQFGVFELKPDTGELLKHGIKVRLQSKPCQILNALLERPGEVVTRDELRSKLWPDDTVDFESGLNTAANRLRISLGDSAERPRYVETLPRVGYRFIAPIQQKVAPASAHEAASSPLPLVLRKPVRKFVPRLAWIAAALLSVLGIAGIVLWTKPSHLEPSVLRQLTFRRGNVGAARFCPGGESILYTAYWSGGEAEVYRVNSVAPESRDLGYAGSLLASVSSKGELALLSEDRLKHHSGATLLRVPENGGSPFAVANGILGADWSPDGEKMAIVREDRGWLIEYPRGKTLYRSSGWVTSVRFSPQGDRIAFIEHPVFGDDGGSIRVVTLSGSARTLSEGWASAWGLAWAPSGREVWFTATRIGANRSLYAVTQTGELRHVTAMPGAMMIHDISKNGRALFSHGEMRMIMDRWSDNAPEQDLSWFDLTNAVDMTADGSQVLFDESGEGGGPGYSVYVLRGKPGDVTRVGAGRALALTPDGRFVLTQVQGDSGNLQLSPLQPGQTRNIASKGMSYFWARFFPEGKRFLFGGKVTGGKPALYVQDTDSGAVKPIEPSIWLQEGPVISSDGSKIAGIKPGEGIVIVSSTGGDPKPLPLSFAANPLRWSRDGKFLFVGDRSIPAKIYRVDVKTGTQTFWKTIGPTDSAGVIGIIHMLLSEDGKSAVYSYGRALSELYVTDSWASQLK
jgi:DNA-binding winged helix-turn-helix (wHTH) protein/Tol biopolymer transport system component